jgi:hypothetical protein
MNRSLLVCLALLVATSSPRTADATDATPLPVSCGQSVVTDGLQANISVARRTDGSLLVTRLVCHVSGAPTDLGLFGERAFLLELYAASREPFATLAFQPMIAGGAPIQVSDATPTFHDEIVFRSVAGLEFGKSYTAVATWRVQVQRAHQAWKTVLLRSNTVVVQDTGAPPHA